MNETHWVTGCAYSYPAAACGNCCSGDCGIVHTARKARPTAARRGRTVAAAGAARRSGSGTSAGPNPRTGRQTNPGAGADTGTKAGGNQACSQAQTPAQTQAATETEAGTSAGGSKGSAIACSTGTGNFRHQPVARRFTFTFAVSAVRAAKSAFAARAPGKDRCFDSCHLRRNKPKTGIPDAVATL